MNPPSDHPDVRHGRIGLLLVNLGTPEATDTSSVRRYLREFLSDRRVIELHPLLWAPILYGPILTLRPRKTAEAYRKIWLRDVDESPLRYYTRRQAEKLQQRLPGVVVDWAMRYGTPAIAERIDALVAAGCDRLVVLPLYPQYSATTSATVADTAFDALKRLRWQPTLRMAHPWYDHPAHIAALASTLRERIAAMATEPERLVLSFHGLPQKYFERGDPYYCHCQKTARLVREALGWPDERVRVTFQSRLGPTEWLQPYTAEVLEQLPAEGVKRIAVAMPGFVTDCIETLEEIGMAGRQGFLDAGGEVCEVLPCLNDSDAGINMLESLARQELAGWL